MTARIRPTIAWSIWAATILLLISVIVLQRLNSVNLRDFILDWHAGEITVSLSFSTVGAVIVAKRWRNAVGWLFLTIGFSLAGGAFARGYAVYALTTGPGGISGGEWAAWFNTWGIELGAVTIALLFLLYPEGRLGSRWLRALAEATAAIGATGILTSAVSPVNFTRYPGVEFPLHLVPLTQARPVYSLYQNLFLFVLLMLAAHLVWRFFRSRGVLRAQMKWFAFAGALSWTLFFASFAWELQPVVFALVFPLIPIGAGIAITRYRLYEINRVINRTIVYTIVTAVLGGLYALLVVTLQAGLRPVTGESDLAIAATTLVVAGLARGVRNFVQRSVDRRFYRKRYDATMTVQNFGNRLRNESTIPELRRDVLEVVRATMQPAHAFLWVGRQH